jgi:UPF0271 protein
VAAKVLRAVTKGTTSSVGGKEVRVVADSICVHSDTPDAMAVAAAVHGALGAFL